MPIHDLRRLFEDFVANAPVAAAAFDREMRYIVHSRSWLAAHGDTSEREIVGKSHYDVFAIRDEWRAVHQRCLAGATEERALDHFVRADGKQELLRWVVTPWRKADGDVGGVLIYIENLTDQVETRRRLGENESIVRDFFAHSPVGLNLCRMDGLWLESNPAFLRIIGYSAEEADGGLTYWQLTPRKYDADEAVQLENLRRTGRYGPYEKEFIRKDGTLVPVRLNGFLVERKGETFIWSLIEDMTEQRALERKLEEERVKAIQSSKLATLGEMAASFAHEINNPLGIIELYAYSLTSAIAEGDTAKIDEAIEAIRSSVTRASRIVKGLRKFSRETASEAFTRLTVNSIVDEAIALCKPRIQGTGVTLTVDVNTDAEVEGHVIELSQVLVNLLNNALDSVTASAGAQGARWIRLDASTSDSSVTIAVEDSGTPPAPGMEEQLFRPFYTTKKVGEGTGLGLSISRSIIDRHGGTLTLDTSSPHTRFVVTLPRAPT